MSKITPINIFETEDGLSGLMFTEKINESQTDYTEIWENERHLFTVDSHNAFIVGEAIKAYRKGYQDAQEPTA